MRTSHHVVWAATSLAAALSVSSMLTAGPLTPPPGPVAPTDIVPGGIEPRTAVSAANTPGDADSLFKITQPGSYYLTGNVTGEAGKSGIEIAASGVTLDLMGFELLGVPGSFTGVVTASVQSVRIHNGSVREWGREGVAAQLARNAALRDLAASGNGFTGLHVGLGGVVERCAAHENFTGISANAGSTVANSTASLNSANGFDAVGATLTGCAARANGQIGMNVADSTVSACTASFNGFHGLRSFGDSLLTGNACNNNGVGAGVTTGAGILADLTGARIEGNNVVGNDVGIAASSGNVVIKNTASRNTTNYSVANATFGPIITDTDMITATNPWTNFIY